MRAPLEGVRVVAVDSYMAAPSAGAILADLGADVVKIEPPNTGDPGRGMRDGATDSEYFTVWNSNT